jgi:hypothetical protein
MKDTICKVCRLDTTSQPYVFRKGWWYHFNHAPPQQDTEDSMNEKTVVIDMIQSTEHALSKVREHAVRHRDSQFLYEATLNLDRARERLNSYLRQLIDDVDDADYPHTAESHHPLGFLPE